MRPLRHRSRLTIGCAAALVATLLAGAGCGLVYDESPRSLDLGETTTTAVESPSAGRFSTVLYYVRDGALLPAAQELPDRSVEASIEALLQPPTTNPPINGLATSIPAGTEVLGVRRNAGQFVIDLSSAFDNVVGLSRQQAIGQIVMSVTQQHEDARLVFLIEGRTLTVSSPARGDRTVVDSCDYAGLLAGIDDAVTVGLQGEALEDLAQRRAELAERCLNRPDFGE